MRRLLRCGKAYRAETSLHGAADAIVDSVALAVAATVRAAAGS
jgi:hypothetical protein